jgi:hypothetical protein
MSDGSNSYFWSARRTIPGWNDSNIFALTCEWRTFSKWYINGQVNILPIPNLHGTNKYIVDPVAAFD